jgi:hypothetical protein
MSGYPPSNSPIGDADITSQSALGDSLGLKLDASYVLYHSHNLHQPIWTDARIIDALAAPASK